MERARAIERAEIDRFAKDRDDEKIILERAYYGRLKEYLLGKKVSSADIKSIKNGDILTDEASVISGSMGLMPSASVGEENALYEPIHGSYPQATGKSIANPIASILSAAMLLDHFQLTKEAALVRKAVDKSLKLQITTPDLNSKTDMVTTSKVGDFIEDFINNPNDTNVNFTNIHLGQSTII